MSDSSSVPPPSGSEQLLGSVVGEKYRIIRPLGVGGMGRVFEAEHTFLRRRLALKFLRSEFTGDPQWVARFRREAQSAGQLVHDNIASVTDFGVTPTGTPYLVMELLEGESLAKIISQEGALTTQRAVALVLQACRALAAAHARGIVHRDIKPEHLMIALRDDGTERLKVLDFGIAKIQESTGTDGVTTKTGTTLGTPYYMSPEQARGDRAVDLRTDIYSLGTVLYEALCGQRPQTGATYNEIIYNILSRKPVPLRERRPELPRALVSVVERAMAADVSERFSSMTAFANALKPYCVPKMAKRPSRPPSTLAHAATAQNAAGFSDALQSRATLDATLSSGGPSTIPRRHRSTLALLHSIRARVTLVVLGVVCVAATALFWNQRRRVAKPTVPSLTSSTPSATASARVPSVKIDAPAVQSSPLALGSTNTNSVPDAGPAPIRATGLPRTARAAAAKPQETPANRQAGGQPGRAARPSYDHENPYE